MLKVTDCCFVCGRFLGQVEGGRWIINLKGADDGEDIGALLIGGEVGIKRDTIPFYNLEKFRASKDEMVHSSDHQFSYLMSALFTPLDMTDHETAFTSFDELGKEIPFEKKNFLYRYVKEPHPQLDALGSIEARENAPLYGTGPT